MESKIRSSKKNIKKGVDKKMRKQNVNQGSFSELLDWLSNNPDIASGKSSCKLLGTISDLIKHLRECTEYSNCFGKPVIGTVQGEKDDDDFLEDDFLDDDFLGDDEDSEIPRAEDLKTSEGINKKKRRTKRDKD